MRDIGQARLVFRIFCQVLIFYLRQFFFQMSPALMNKSLCKILMARTLYRKYEIVFLYEFSIDVAIKI